MAKPLLTVYWVYRHRRFEVLWLAHGFERTVDDKGMPSTCITPAPVRFLLRETDTATVEYAMCSHQREHSHFEAEGPDGSVRRLLGVQAAYLVRYAIDFDTIGRPNHLPAKLFGLTLSAAALDFGHGIVLENHSVLPWDAPLEVQRRARLEGWSEAQAAAMPAPGPDLKVAAPPKQKPPTLTGNQNKSIYGEHISDAYMRAQGHQKLNDGGNLTPLPPHPARGTGIDGVWKHASPPPDYVITEAKYHKSRLGKTINSGKQMSDQWILSDRRLERAVGPRAARRILSAMTAGRVEKRLHQIAPDGTLTETILL